MLLNDLILVFLFYIVSLSRISCVWASFLFLHYSFVIKSIKWLYSILCVTSKFFSNNLLMKIDSLWITFFGLVVCFILFYHLCVCEVNGIWKWYVCLTHVLHFMSKWKNESQRDRSASFYKIYIYIPFWQMQFELFDCVYIYTNMWNSKRLSESFSPKPKVKIG